MQMWKDVKGTEPALHLLVISTYPDLLISPKWRLGYLVLEKITET